MIIWCWLWPHKESVHPKTKEKVYKQNDTEQYKWKDPLLSQTSRFVALLLEANGVKIINVQAICYKHHIPQKAAGVLAQL